MKAQIKEGKCPQCGKELFRRHAQPTYCNYCNYFIERFKDVFKPRPLRYKNL